MPLAYPSVVTPKPRGPGGRPWERAVA